MAGGVNALANLMGKVDANNALLVALSGSLPAAAFPLLAPDGTAAAPSYSWSGDPDTGFFRRAASPTSEFGISNDGVASILISNSYLAMKAAMSLGWETSTSGSGFDLSLIRSGAGFLLQRNSTNAQRFDIANTYTSATNYEAFSVDWQTAANVAFVGTRTAATGTSRALRLLSQDTNGSTTYAVINLSNTAPFVRFDRSAPDLTSISTSQTGNWFQTGGAVISTATSGTLAFVAILPTYNQASGNAANTDLLINRTETAIGSGAQLLFDAQVGGASRFSIDRLGIVSVAANLLTGGYSQLSSSGNTTSGQVGTAGSKTRAVSGLGNAVAGDMFTVTVPNAAHMATIRVCYSASLGAGGAIGAGEATGNIAYDVAVTRTAGVATVATFSAAYGSSTSAVAGAATITVVGDASAMVGAVGATQTFTIRVTVTRGSGASANHTCRATVEIINANASGITVS